MDKYQFPPFILQGHILVWAEWQAGVWDEYIEDGEITLDSLDCELFDEGKFHTELEERVGRWVLWYHDIEMKLKTNKGFYEEGLAIAKAVREMVPKNINVYYEDQNSNRIEM